MGKSGEGVLAPVGKFLVWAADSMSSIPDPGGGGDCGVHPQEVIFFLDLNRHLFINKSL